MTDATGGETLPSAPGRARAQGQAMRQSPAPTPPQDAATEADTRPGAGLGGPAASTAAPPPGVTVYHPNEAPDGALNPRSCVTCRRRKVRCDKRMPCTNCRRAQISCVFPSPGRAPRRPRPKDPAATSSTTAKHHSSEREVELMRRLRKLEGIVEELSGQIELESTRHNSSSAGSPEGVTSPPAVQQDSITATSGGIAQGPTRATSSGNISNTAQLTPLSRPGLNIRPTSPPGGICPKAGAGSGAGAFGMLRASEMNKNFGRLVIHDDGKARYVSSGFWSRINDELNELRAETEEMLDSDSDGSDAAEDTPETITGDMPGAFGHNAFLFGYRSCDVDLRSYHPLPSQIPFMWQVYLLNVQPISKILHGPTMTKKMDELRNKLDSLDPATEALMFAIYLGAITSLDEEEVSQNFGSEKSFLLAQYRFAVEQALAKANFLTSSEVTTLQALVLYVILVRRRNDTRFAWTMVGLAVRICQSIGLHREPSNFPNLTPFEAEMRRRLFWQLAVVDFRAAEDQGTDASIIDRAWDTRMPLNINDSDFGPETEVMPAPRVGPTEMIFCLMSFEVVLVARRLHVMTSANALICPRDAASTVEDRERMLGSLYEKVERITPREAPSPANALSWTASTVGRVVVAKMTIIIYQSVLFPGPGNDELSPEIKDRLFSAAVEVFEYGHLLQTDPRCRPWRWMFGSYTQWQTAAYILLEVSHRPWSALSERAWFALNANFSSALAADIDRMADNAAVWVPFKRLYHNARRYRNAEIARLKADPRAAADLDREYYFNAQPTSFGDLSGSIKSAVAREKWRKLVDVPSLPPDQEQQQRQQQQQQQQQKPLNLPPWLSLGTRLPHLASTPANSPTTGTPANPAGGYAGAGGLVATRITSSPNRSSSSSNNNNNTINNNRATGLGQPPLAENLMDFMDQVMSQPTFAPSDFFPVVLSQFAVNNVMPPPSTSPNNDPARFAFAGGAGQMNNPAAQQQQQQQPPPPPPTTTTTAAEAQAESDTPLVDAMRKNYPPPWLWSDSVFGESTPYNPFGRTNTDSTATANATIAAAVVAPATTTTMKTGAPSAVAVSAPPLDDFDVNMDGGDFNWQDFGESIRDFQAQVDSGGGGAGSSLWGPFK